MHLIIAACGSAAAAQARPGTTPDAEWAPLLARLRPTWRLQGHADSLSTPAERVRLRLLLGRDPTEGEDGRLPWMAWQLGRMGAVGALDDAGAWGRLTPYHGLVGSDRITFVPPAELTLQADESLALFKAVLPLFESEGVHLRWVDATTWAVRHDSLRGLPCASIDRVAHDSVQLWQVRTPLAQARLLRRLQNEAQMVLHGHAVNDARAARGLLPVNSLWLSDAGAADEFEPLGGLADTPYAATAAHSLQSLAVHPLAAPEAIEGWLQQTSSHVGAAAETTHATAPAPATAPATATATATAHAAQEIPPTLVLCGRAHAQAFEWASPQAAGWWSRIKQAISAPPAAPTFSQWWSGLDETE